jgi:hypothetical protein
MMKLLVDRFWPYSQPTTDTGVKLLRIANIAVCHAIQVYYSILSLARDFVIFLYVPCLFPSKTAKSFWHNLPKCQHTSREPPSLALFSLY